MTSFTVFAFSSGTHAAVGWEAKPFAYHPTDLLDRCAAPSAAQFPRRPVEAKQGGAQGEALLDTNGGVDDAVVWKTLALGITLFTTTSLRALSTQPRYEPG